MSKKDNPNIVIREYDEWVRKDIPLDEDWIEEINALTFIRLDIEKNVKKYGRKQIQIINNLDKKCSKQLSISCGYQINPEKWWEHVEVQRIKNSDYCPS